ncbi:hypothetical protein BgiBS90_038062, partial [Biomphalaria glabrata]
MVFALQIFLKYFNDRSRNKKLKRALQNCTCHCDITIKKKSNSFSLKVFFSEVSSPRKSYLEVKK